MRYRTVCSGRRRRYGEVPSLAVNDASYLELAMREGLTVATLDQDLQKAAGKSGVKRFAAR